MACFCTGACFRTGYCGAAMGFDEDGRLIDIFSKTRDQQKAKRKYDMLIAQHAVPENEPGAYPGCEFFWGR